MVCAQMSKSDTSCANSGLRRSLWQQPLRQEFQRNRWQCTIGNVARYLLQRLKLKKQKLQQGEYAGDCGAEPGYYMPTAGVQAKLRRGGGCQLTLIHPLYKPAETTLSSICYNPAGT